VTSTRRAVVLLGAVVVALLTAWYAGSRAPSLPPPPPGSVRLGPEAGEVVADYLARLPAELPPSGVVAPALVQFAAEQDTDGALAATAGTVAVLAVFRVPIQRVQTALRFEGVEDAVAPPTALGSARDRARSSAVDDADRLTGRARVVAGVEAAELADPACACVLAVVVRGDRTALQALLTRPGVRAVHAAPPDAAPAELALSPLLPAQTERADPLPDDGPVPASGRVRPRAGDGHPDTENDPTMGDDPVWTR